MIAKSHSQLKPVPAVVMTQQKPAAMTRKPECDTGSIGVCVMHKNAVDRGTNQQLQ